MKKTVSWVYLGGAAGEMAHCERCGEGLRLGDSQPLYLFAAIFKAFVNHHSKCEDTGRIAELPADVYAWFRGRDTGTSSLTIYSVFMCTDSPHGRYSVPQDPDDFGRCHRLLELKPEWRLRLHEVGEKYPAWKPMVKHWDEMTKLYLEELPKGSAPKLYELMKQLRNPCPAK